MAAGALLQRWLEVEAAPLKADLAAEAFLLEEEQEAQRAAKKNKRKKR